MGAEEEKTFVHILFVFQADLATSTVKYEITGFITRLFSGSWKKLDDVNNAFLFQSVYPLPNVIYLPLPLCKFLCDMDMYLHKIYLYLC